MFLDPDFLNMAPIKFCYVFQHLYVLYLEMHVDNMSIVPKAIGSLYHLKFLKLRGIHDLPSSIGNLKNLQTLLVNDYGYFCQLPRETTDLINLRHLVASYSKPLKRINKLTSLQVLKGIHCDQWKDVDAVDLVNLRELSMHDITKSYSLNNITNPQRPLLYNFVDFSFSSFSINSVLILGRRSCHLKTFTLMWAVEA